MYLDDILVYTDTMEEHVKLVQVVLKKLHKAQLYANLSKHEFHKTKLDYLGYWLSQEGVEMDPENICAILE